MKSNFHTFVYWFICLLVYLFIPLGAVRASGAFQADYDVRYDVAPTGVTIVTQDVVLTNNLTNLYPKEYSIIIDSDKIADVIASDGGGIISPVISVKDGKTTITLPFKQKVVGMGKKLSFTLRYRHNDIAKKSGRIWEINIPGVENDPDIGSYRVSLTTPAGFGPNAYLSPLPADGGYWTKDQMIRGGISAAFGDKQIFIFDLRYAISNPAVTTKRSEIALPPDTPYQNVSITGITPQPKTVVRDSDGNWLAQYDLLPNQRLDIQAEVAVALRLNPRPSSAAQAVNPADYLKPLPYWQVYDPKIMDLAKQYKTPREIYEFVVKKLTYDYERVSQNPARLGALGALAEPTKAICMEFTDLFIAIARAAGIPAREVVGFAYTTNSRLRPLSLVADVLHAWPEYYDGERKIWVQIDPTWANTTGGVNYFDKLDFNHVAFAIHGLSSELPYPAGFYRAPDHTGKDVRVRFAENEPAPSPDQFSITINFPKKITAGLAASGTVTIQNISGVGIPEASVSIQSFPQNIAINSLLTKLPPYGTLTTPITFRSNSLLEPGQGKILVTANGQTNSLTFTIDPLYILIIPLGGGVIALILLGWLLANRKALWKKFAKH